MTLAKRLVGRFRTYSAPLPMQDFDTYEGYWEERGGEPFIHPRWKLAVEKIPDGATVLDVGCGSGGFLTYLRSQRPNVIATGTDISNAGVKDAQAAGFEAFQADLTNDDLPGTYDYITCFEAIEHIVEAEVVLQKLRDATRKQLIMSLPNFGYLDHRIRLAMFGRFPNTNLMFHVKEHVRHWTVKDFTEWTGHFGLHVVQVQGQYGGRFMPWERFPALLCPQVLYTLERA